MRLQRTRVRLHHLGGGEDVALSDIQGVTSWDDVAVLITSVRPIIVREALGQRRMAFAAGVILWAETLTDDA
jgi:hypothetical protein